MHAHQDKGDIMSTDIAHLFTRQQRLDVVVPETISIVGVGGIGFWVALNAAMLGVDKLVLYDPDTIENHNRNRLPLAEEDVGKNKVVAAREYIQRIRPDCTVFALPMAINEISMSQLEGFVFICTDTLSSQGSVRTHCVENNLPFLRLGYDGRHFTMENKETMDGVFSVEEEPDDRGQYTVVPSYVLTPQLISGIALTLCDMNVWRGFPRRKPEIDISGNIFHLGQAILQGEIFSQELRYPDRLADGVQMLAADGRRIRI